MQLQSPTATTSAPFTSTLPAPGEVGHGSVTWFNAEKGFGFITPDDGGAAVFAHHASVEEPASGTLREGDHVSWVYAAGDKGPRATHIRVDALAGADLLRAAPTTT